MMPKILPEQLEAPVARANDISNPQNIQSRLNGYRNGGLKRLTPNPARKITTPPPRPEGTGQYRLTTPTKDLAKGNTSLEKTGSLQNPKSVVKPGSNSLPTARIVANNYAQFARPAPTTLAVPDKTARLVTDVISL